MLHDRRLCSAVAPASFFLAPFLYPSISVSLPLPLFDFRGLSLFYLFLPFFLFSVSLSLSFLYPPFPTLLSLSRLRETQCVIYSILFTKASAKVRRGSTSRDTSASSPAARPTVLSPLPRASSPRPRPAAAFRQPPPLLKITKEKET